MRMPRVVVSLVRTPLLAGGVMPRDVRLSSSLMSLDLSLTEPLLSEP
jgi:hypothetical protein